MQWATCTNSWACYWVSHNTAIGICKGYGKLPICPHTVVFRHDYVVAGTGFRLAGVGVLDKKVHGEFIVYDRVQVYSEYLIYLEV